MPTSTAELQSRLRLLEIRYQLDKIIQTGSNDDFAGCSVPAISNLCAKKSACVRCTPYNGYSFLLFPHHSKTDLLSSTSIILSLRSHVLRITWYCLQFYIDYWRIDNNHFQDSIKFGYGICFSGFFPHFFNLVCIVKMLTTTFGWVANIREQHKLNKSSMLHNLIDHFFRIQLSFS